MTSRSDWDPNFDGVVGTAPADVTVNAGETVQAAIDDNGSGTTIAIADGYNPDDESFPILVDHAGITIRGGQGGPGTTATIRNTTGNHTFHLNPGNERNPGIALLDMNIVQTNGGNAVRNKNAKFGYFENVHADGNNNGSDDLWFFGSATDSWANNSQVFVQCSAEQAGRDGWQLGNICHHVAMFGCTALACGRFGVYMNGPYSGKFIGGQLEDCAEAGFRARQADCMYVGGGTYVEANAKTANFGDADLVFTDSDNCIVEGPMWANGKTGGSAAVVRFDGVVTGAVSGIQTDGDYADIAYIVNASDIDVHASTHLLGQGVGVAAVQPSAERVRDHGIIVGAGSNNGGNDGINGVDLGSVSGAHNRDRAIADGTTANASGLTAVWLAGSGVWQPSDGGATI